MRRANLVVDIYLDLLFFDALSEDILRLNGVVMTEARTGMDRQMSLDDVEGLDELFARRAREAELALCDFEVQRGVSYGAAPAEKLNIFPSTRNAPVMIFFHGGFWKSLDADLFSFLAPGFVPFGAALVVIDYPLMPSSRMADIVASCQRAVSWVQKNAARFGGDANRIFLSGNSAGGHLVAEVMSRPEGDIILGGTAISGLFDLIPVTQSFQNEDLYLTLEEVRNFSPLSRPVGVTAPMIVAVGADETDEFLRQSIVYAEQIGTQAMLVKDCNHITVVLDGLAKPTSKLNRAVRSQMGLQV
ncbi:alpha/beta hydrolase [Loktanella sp. DJP18]|uniref:alpha/beta hydrolase n=1 Tax=Loktanella sp. DJP18 TaxID=3409788 RepID=UPI003BB69FF8